MANLSFNLEVFIAIWNVSSPAFFSLKSQQEKLLTAEEGATIADLSIDLNNAIWFYWGSNFFYHPQVLIFAGYASTYLVYGLTFFSGKAEV